MLKVRRAATILVSVLVSAQYQHFGGIGIGKVYVIQVPIPLLVCCILGHH